MDHVLHLVLVGVSLAALFVVPPVIGVPVVLAAAGMALATSVAVNRAMRAPVRTGNESLAGGTGTVVKWEGRTGLVRTGGELWCATGASGLKPGDGVQIERAQSTVLHVRSQYTGGTPVLTRG